MSDVFEKVLRDFWEKHVAGGFIYRGMGQHDLGDELDPAHDPFREIRPRLFVLIKVLEEAMSCGFQFTVHEDYSGYSFTLNDIIAWSRGDLGNPGLDFTSVYNDACGYSENYMGSQLKQNFKYITDHLPERKDDPILRQCMKKEHWDIVDAINRWITDGDKTHERIVVWVKRSHPALDSDSCLPLGTYDNFRNNCLQEMINQSLPSEEKSLGMLVPENFCYRLTRLIQRREISRVETVTSNI